MCCFKRSIVGRNCSRCKPSRYKLSGAVFEVVTKHKPASNKYSKSGTWFSYEKERLGQGRDNSIKFLEENPGIADTINLKVRALNNLDSAEQSQEAQEIAAEE